MRTEHHLRKSTLLEYAAGTLPEALNVVAASHLAWCRECRRAVVAKRRDEQQQESRTAIPADSARLTQTVLSARYSPAPEAAELAGAEMADFGLPLPLAMRLDGCGLDQVPWRKILPGVALRDLELPPGAAGQLRLVRLLPGRALPQHGHGGCELSLVLRGAYRDQLGRYTIGDIADLDHTAVHRPVAEDGEPCICLVAAETPARFHSWLGRLGQWLHGL